MILPRRRLSKTKQGRTIHCEEKENDIICNQNKTINNYYREITTQFIKGEIKLLTNKINATVVPNQN